MKKLILIDGNAILHKAYHGLPPFRTAQGVLVNAVYGFGSVLLNMLNIEKPDYIACAFDVKGGTFRHEESEIYKANRTKAPDDLYEQLPLIKEMLAAFCVQVYEKEGYEADDVIGTLCKEAEKLGVKNYIVTGDMDACQLVNEKTTLYAMHKGFSQPVVYDRERVLERYELEPKQVIDLKGLAGDSSDNIKGVMGIGKKTATKLLKKYETVEGVYENLDELKGAVLKKLSEGRESAFLSKMLATIVTDVELDFRLEDCEAFSCEIEKVRGLFGVLGFKSLMAKLMIFGKEMERRKMAEIQGSLF